MFFAESEFLIIWIVLGIGLIALVVFFLRKYIPGLGFEEEEVDEKKRIEEEVNRYIVTEETKEETKKNEEE